MLSKQSYSTDMVPADSKTIPDEIVNFENLRLNLSAKLKLDDWMVWKSPENLHIFSLNRKSNGNLSIRNTVYIDIDLTVKAFEGDDDETMFDSKVYHWHQLQTLIDQLCHRRIKNEIISEEFTVTEDENRRVPFEFCAINIKSEVSNKNGY